MEVFTRNPGAAFAQAQTDLDNNASLSCKTSAQHESSLRRRYAREVKEASGKKLSPQQSNRVEWQRQQDQRLQDVKLSIKCLEDGKIRLNFTQGFLPQKVQTGAIQDLRRSVRRSTIELKKEQGKFHVVGSGGLITGGQLVDLNNPKGFTIKYDHPLVGSLLARVDADGNVKISKVLSRVPIILETTGKVDITGTILGKSLFLKGSHITSSGECYVKELQLDAVNSNGQVGVIANTPKAKMLVKRKITVKHGDFENKGLIKGYSEKYCLDLELNQNNFTNAPKLDHKGKLEAIPAVFGRGGLSLRHAVRVDNRGILASNQGLNVRAQFLKNYAQLFARGAFRGDIAHDFVHAKGAAFGAASVDLKVEAFDNYAAIDVEGAVKIHGQTGGKNTLVNYEEGTIAGSELDVKLNSVENSNVMESRHGLLKLHLTHLQNKRGRLKAGGDSTITIAEELSNEAVLDLGDSSEVKVGMLTNTGEIKLKEKLDLTVQYLRHLSGVIRVGGDVRIAGFKEWWNAGNFTAMGALSLEEVEESALVNKGMVGAQSLKGRLNRIENQEGALLGLVDEALLAAQSFVNDGRFMVGAHADINTAEFGNTGDIEIGTKLELAAEYLKHLSGSIRVGDDVRLIGLKEWINQGDFSAEGGLSLEESSEGSINNAGTIEVARLSGQVSGIENQREAVLQVVEEAFLSAQSFVNDGRFNVGAYANLETATLTNTGDIAIGAQLDLTVAYLKHLAGSIRAGGDVHLVSFKEWVNQGDFTTEGALLLDDAQKALVNNLGAIEAYSLEGRITAIRNQKNAVLEMKQHAFLRTKTFINDGEFSAQGDIDLEATTQAVNTDSLYSGKSIITRARKILNAGSAAVIKAEELLVLQADTLEGDGQAYGEVINLAARLMRTQGMIKASQELSLSIGRLEQLTKWAGDVSDESRGTQENSLESIMGEVALVAPVIRGNVDHLLNASLIDAKRRLELNIGVLENAGIIESSSGGGVFLKLHEDSKNKGLIHTAGKLFLDINKSLENLKECFVAVQDAEGLGARIEGGAVVLRGKGRFENEGLVHSEGIIRGETQHINNAGMMAAEGNFTNQVAALINSGLMQSESLLVTEADTVTNLGQMLSQGMLVATVKDFLRTSGQMHALEAVKLKAAKLNNEGSVASVQDVLRVIADAVTNTGQMSSAQAADFEAKSLENEGLIESIEGALDVSARTVDNSGQMRATKANKLKARTLKNEGLIESIEDTLGLKLGTGENSGELFGQEIQLSKTGAFTNHDQILGNRLVKVFGNGQLTNLGSVSAVGAIDATGQTLDNQGDITGLSEDSKVALKFAQKITNTEGASIASAGELDVEAPIVSADGLIEAGKALDLSAGTVSGSGSVRADELSFEQRDEALSFNAEGITLESGEQMHLNVPKGLTVQDRSKLNVGNHLTVERSEYLRNETGQALKFAGDFIGDFTQGFTNDHGIVAGGRLGLSFDGDLQNNDQLQGMAGLELAARSVTNDGRIYSGFGGRLKAMSGVVNNRGIGSTGDFEIETESGDIFNDSGEIYTWTAYQGDKEVQPGALSFRTPNGRLRNIAGVVDADGPITLRGVDFENNRRDIQEIEDPKAELYYEGRWIALKGIGLTYQNKIRPVKRAISSYNKKAGLAGTIDGCGNVKIDRSLYNFPLGEWILDNDGSHNHTIWRVTNNRGRIEFIERYNPTEWHHDGHCNEPKKVKLYAKETSRASSIISRKSIVVDTKTILNEASDIVSDGPITLRFDRFYNRARPLSRKKSRIRNWTTTGHKGFRRKSVTFYHSEVVWDDKPLRTSGQVVSSKNILLAPKESKLVQVSAALGKNRKIKSVRNTGDILAGRTVTIEGTGTEAVRNGLFDHNVPTPADFVPQARTELMDFVGRIGEHDFARYSDPEDGEFVVIPNLDLNYKAIAEREGLKETDLTQRPKEFAALRDGETSLDAPHALHPLLASKALSQALMQEIGRPYLDLEKPKPIGQYLDLVKAGVEQAKPWSKADEDSEEPIRVNQDQIDSFETINITLVPKIVNGRKCYAGVLNIPPKERVAATRSAEGRIEAKVIEMLKLGDVHNTGTFFGKERVSIKVESFTNERRTYRYFVTIREDGGLFKKDRNKVYEIRVPQKGGNVVGAEVIVEAIKDIVNRGGNVLGNDVKLVSYEGNVVATPTIGTHVVQWNPGGWGRVMGKESSSLATDYYPASFLSKGNLVIKAINGKVIIDGSKVKAQKDAVLSGKKGVDISAKMTTYKSKDSAHQGGFKITTKTEETVVSERSEVISHNGNVYLYSDEGIVKITGSSVVASDGDINMHGAKGNVVDVAKVKVHSSGSTTQRKTLSLNYEKSKTTRDSVERSVIVGNNINMITALDNELRGAIMNAAVDINFDAGRNNIIEGAEEVTETNIKGFSLGLSFFGSDAIKAMVDGEGAGEAALALLDQDSFLRSLHNFVLAGDKADLVAAGTMIGVESVKLAHLLSMDSALSVKQRLGQRLGLLNKDGKFDPNITVRLGTYFQDIIRKHIIRTAMNAGNNINIKSGDKSNISGDLEAGDTISVEASEVNFSGSTDTMSSTQKGGGVSVSQSSVGADASGATCESAIVTNSNLKARVVSVTATGDINHTSTNAEAEIITYTAGGDINIRSEQSYTKSHAWYASASTSGAVAGGENEESDVWIEKQAGLHAQNQLTLNTPGEINLHAANVLCDVDNQAHLNAAAVNIFDLEEHHNVTGVNVALSANVHVGEQSKSVKVVPEAGLLGLGDMGVVSHEKRGLVHTTLKGVSSTTLSSYNIQDVNQAIETARQTVKDSKTHVRLVIPVVSTKDLKETWRRFRERPINPANPQLIAAQQVRNEGEPTDPSLDERVEANLDYIKDVRLKLRRSGMTEKQVEAFLNNQFVNQTLSGVANFINGFDELDDVRISVGYEKKPAGLELKVRVIPQLSGEAATSKSDRALDACIEATEILAVLCNDLPRRERAQTIEAFREVVRPFAQYLVNDALGNDYRGNLSLDRKRMYTNLGVSFNPSGYQAEEVQKACIFALNTLNGRPEDMLLANDKALTQQALGNGAKPVSLVEPVNFNVKQRPPRQTKVTRATSSTAAWRAKAAGRLKESGKPLSLENMQDNRTEHLLDQEKLTPSEINEVVVQTGKSKEEVQAQIKNNKETGEARRARIAERKRLARDEKVAKLLDLEELSASQIHEVIRHTGMSEAEVKAQLVHNKESRIARQAEEKRQRRLIAQQRMEEAEREKNNVYSQTTTLAEATSSLEDEVKEAKKSFFQSIGDLLLQAHAPEFEADLKRGEELLAASEYLSNTVTEFAEDYIEADHKRWLEANNGRIQETMALLKYRASSMEQAGEAALNSINELHSDPKGKAEAIEDTIPPLDFSTMTSEVKAFQDVKDIVFNSFNTTALSQYENTPDKTIGERVSSIMFDKLLECDLPPVARMCVMHTKKEYANAISDPLAFGRGLILGGLCLLKDVGEGTWQGYKELYGLFEDGISGDLARDLAYIDENYDAINDGLGQYTREVSAHLAEALSTHEGRGYFVGQIIAGSALGHASKLAAATRTGATASLNIGRAMLAEVEGITSGLVESGTGALLRTEARVGALVEGQFTGLLPVAETAGGQVSRNLLQRTNATRVNRTAPRRTGGRPNLQGAPKKLAAKKKSGVAVPKKNVASSSSSTSSVRTSRTKPTTSGSSSKPIPRQTQKMRATRSQGPSRNTGSASKANKSYPTKYHEVSVEEVAKLRREFDAIKRKFLKDYAKTEEAARRFSVSEIELLQQGYLPEGWIVHHKKPLFRGGANEYSNLRLMKKKLHRKCNKPLHYYEKGKNIYGNN